LKRAPKKLGAGVLGVVLQNRHYEDKPLKLLKRRHAVDFEMFVANSDWLALR
jgi:hypothetical protein